MAITSGGISAGAQMSISAQAASAMVGFAIATGLSLEAQDARVMQVLERGRLALARGTELALPSTFAITGQRVINGDAGKRYAFEIYAQLPDKFVWKEDQM